MRNFHIVMRNPCEITVVKFRIMTYNKYNQSIAIKLLCGGATWNIYLAQMHQKQWDFLYEESNRCAKR